MKVMITGITGFVGSHLAEFLLDRGIEVHGIVRWRSKHDNIEHLSGHPRLRLHDCDLRDASAIHEVLAKVRPSRIFHLAAQSFVPTSWLAPAETLSTNINGQLHLFEAIRQLKLDPIVQIAGSSEEYGIIYPRELPIKESNPLRPLSPYGVSKVGQDLLGYQYHMSYGLRVIRTRAFNHTGPRRGQVFVISNFAKQIASIEAGLQSPSIQVGNLTARRDFTDVRDVVRAYWLATEKGKSGEVYNIASGTDYTIKWLLNKLIKLSPVKIDVVQDPDRMRPSDIQRLLGDSTKFRKLTGWKPEIPIEQTLEDTLDYWREKIAEMGSRRGASAHSTKSTKSTGTRKTKTSAKASTKRTKTSTRASASTKSRKSAAAKKTKSATSRTTTAAKAGGTKTRTTKKSATAKKAATRKTSSTVSTTKRRSAKAAKTPRTAAKKRPATGAATRKKRGSR